MTTSLERYADVMPEPDDPALVRLVGALDRALQAVLAPPQVQTTMQQVLVQRADVAAPVVAEHPAPVTLSRKDALKAGIAAAGAAWLLALGHTSPAIASEIGRLAEEGPMTAARLGAVLRDERAQWNALLAEVGPERMDVPGVEGTWSVKQIVAHLTWYENVIVEGAQQLMSTGTYVREGLRALSMDERNAVLAEQSRGRPVQDVLAEAEQVFGQLLTVIAACPDDLLNDPRRLGLPDDVVPWMAVANNSYGHYQEHAQAIRAWLDAFPGPAPRSDAART
jgi:hypothetical protein